MDDDQIRRMLERLGQALSTGDVKGVASCWAVPSLVLSENGATPVAALSEVETFFAQAIEWYRSRGLVSTKPEVERIERLSDRLSAVDVRWPAFDSAGREQAAERSHYLLQRGDDGQPRIRVALTRTA
jgi:hypothetical protein